MMWLLLNAYWLLALVAGIMVVLAIIPATGWIVEWLADHAPKGTVHTLAALFVISWASDWLVGYGAGRCEARWEAAQEATQAEIDRREQAAFMAGADAAQKAAQAQADTRKQTDEAVERVRTVWREKVVKVPAQCRAAVELPESVRIEGRKAVKRARDA